MTKLLMALFALSGALASAQEINAKPETHGIFLDLSMSRGGLGVGAGYEYMLDPNAGWAVGGQVRGYSKDQGSYANGLMIFGVTTGFHFFKKAWDLEFAPSLNLISIDSYQRVPGDATTLGPGLTVSLTVQLTDRVGLGFALNEYYAWFTTNYRGVVMNDLALRGKFSF